MSGELDAPHGLRLAAGTPVRLDLVRSHGHLVRQVTDVFAGPTARLDSLTGLRFVAAVLVVVHHTVSNPNHAAGIAVVPWLEPLATIGYTGVSFFFALSGFVLAWSWRPGRGPKEFWIRRFARVYPLHLVTWLLAIALAIWVGDHVDVVAAIVGGLLLQAWTPDTSITFALNAPSWSLACEAFFYAMFPLLIIPLSRLSVRRLGLVIAGAVALLAAIPAVMWVALGRDAVGILYSFPAYRVLEFVIGISLALAMRRGWRPKVPTWGGLLIVAAGLGATMGIGALYVAHVPGAMSLPRPAAALLMLPFYVVLIAIAASGDIAGRSSFFARPFMVRLGTWSFAAYMTHLLMLEVVERLDGGLLPVTDVWLNLLVVVIVLVGATLLSALAYTAVEHPLERRVRSILLPRRRTAPAPTTAQAGILEPEPIDQQRVPVEDAAQLVDDEPIVPESESGRPAAEPGSTEDEADVGDEPKDDPDEVWAALIAAAPSAPAEPVGGRRVLLALTAVLVAVAVLGTLLVLRPWATVQAGRGASSPSTTAGSAVRPVVSVIGDAVSVGEGTWPGRLPASLGVSTRTWGGVGARFSASGANAYAALAANVDPSSVAVVVMASRDDRTQPTLALVKAATETVAAATEAAPKATVLLVGPVWADSDSPTMVDRVRSALKSAAAVASVTWIDPVADGWFTSDAVPAARLTAAGTESTIADRLSRRLDSALKEER